MSRLKEFIVLVIALAIIPVHGQGQGPICFSCPNVNNPEDCRNHTTCSSEQVCSVQEVIAPHGYVYFWAGCESLELCAELSETSTSEIIIGKRQLSADKNRCVYCCSNDLCNRNCTEFVNLALHKPAYQSSVYTHVPGPPGLAVDGNRDKNYFHGSCSLTGAENYAWWTVDLQNEYHITNVKIYERSDAQFANYSFHIKVLVSSYNATKLDRDSNLFTECGHYFGQSSEGNVIGIECPLNITGRWVRIQQNAPKVEWLHLCEVEVFGY